MVRVLSQGAGDPRQVPPLSLAGQHPCVVKPESLCSTASVGDQGPRAPWWGPWFAPWQHLRGGGKGVGEYPHLEPWGANLASYRAAQQGLQDPGELPGGRGLTSARAAAHWRLPSSQALAQSLQAFPAPAAALLPISLPSPGAPPAGSQARPTGPKRSSFRRAGIDSEPLSSLPPHTPTWPATSNGAEPLSAAAGGPGTF